MTVSKLTANTVVIKGFEPVSLSAGDEIPEWAADQIGDHIVEQEEPKVPARKSAPVAQKNPAPADQA